MTTRESRRIGAPRRALRSGLRCEGRGEWRNTEPIPKEEPPELLLRVCGPLQETFHRVVPRLQVLLVRE